MRKAWDIISNIILIVVIIFTIFTVGVRLLHITPYAVLSGSMEPTYSVGELIYVKDMEPEQIKEGDPITFVLNANKQIATHRVVQVDEVNKSFITKGDANEKIDGQPVLYENLIGKPIFHIPYMGYFVNWLQSKQGIIIASCAIVAYIILSMCLGKSKKVEKPVE